MIEIIDGRVWRDDTLVMELSKEEMKGVDAYIKLLLMGRAMKQTMEGFK
jgi:hypothetical protein